MIAVKDLVKNYSENGTVTRALASVTFKIGIGEFVAIMGPSGSGKSTLLHILGFLDRPTSGVYEFAGKSIDALDDEGLAHIRNSQMGFIFQSFNLLGRSSVYENVELPLLYNPHIAVHEREFLVKRAVESVGLLDRINTEAGRLSGGERQRVAIARALVGGPQVIFADEPTGNLDSQSGKQVMEILRRLNKEGHTIILITHETYTAHYADRLIRIKDGSVEADERLEQKPEEQYFK